MFINWLKKRLGYHVCEEFTQWETKEARYSRPTTLADGIMPDFFNNETTKEIIWNERWQERRCTICGEIQQRKLNN